MCNWKNWIWPGIVTTALLTALTGWFLSGHVHHDLSLRAGDQLRAGQPWAKVAFSGRDGTVSGIAENDIQRREAEAIARSTYGVRIVDNQTALPPKADPFTFSAVKEGQGVTLKGNFASTAERQALVAAAETAMPGIAVKDELTLASGAPAGFADLARFGVGQLADLSSGEVSLSNLDYALKGIAADGEAYVKADAAVRGALPGGGVLKSADLSLPAASGAYAFGATVGDGAVALTGFAPSVETRAALEEAAKSLFPGMTVSNALALASGAPENFASLAQFGLGQLAGLATGEVSLSGADFSIKGEAKDEAGFAAVTAALAALPEGVKLAVANIIPAKASPFVWGLGQTAGGVELTGFVPDKDTGMKLVELAKSVFAGSMVTDSQKLASGAPRGFADVAAAAINALKGFNNAVASISDATVSLSGVAPAGTDVTAVAEGFAKLLPAGFSQKSALTVEAPPPAPEPAPAPEPVKPFEWTAVLDASGLKLSGDSAGAEGAKALLESAAKRFIKTEITDAQVARDKAPDGFVDTQAALLKGLGFLVDGKASLNDRSASLTGTAPAQSIKDFVVAKLTASLPAGYQLAADIKVVEPAPAPAPEPAPAVAPAPAPEAKKCADDIAAILAASQINFSVSKADIKDDSFAVIASIAEALKGCAEARMEIGGHTDSDGIAGSNQKLSEARANAVRDLLLKAGIDAARLTAKGYGSDVPLAANDTAENKAKNRRIEFRLIP